MAVRRSAFPTRSVERIGAGYARRIELKQQ